MKWSKDQGQAVEELLAKADKSIELEKRVTELEAKINTLEDLLCTRQ